MTAVLLKTLRGHILTLTLAALLVAGFGILLSVSYSSLGDGYIEFLNKSMPEAMAALLKTEGSLLAASGVQGFIAIGFRHPLFLVVISAFAIATASGALALEVERRTILLLLARPLPRYRLVLGKALESAFGLLVLVTALLAGAYIGVLIGGLAGSVDVASLLLMTLGALTLALAIMGYAYLFSALSSDGGRATLLATGLTVVLFFVDYVSSLFDVLEPLGFISIFYYYNPGALAADPAFPVRDVAVLLSVAVVTLGAALVVFQRRDIAA